MRDLEEQRMAEAAEGSDDGDDNLPHRAAPAFAGFAALGGSDSEESESESSESDEEEARARRAAAAEARAKEQQRQRQQQQAKKKKQQQKKAKAKAKAAASDEWTPDDEAMLASIAASKASEAAAEADVLVPDPRHLDPQAELRRIFGKNVVDEARREEQQEHQHGRGGRRGRGRGRGGAAAKLRRTVLIQPRDHWPPYAPSGLEMEVTHSDADASFFQFRHSEDYQKAQQEYEVAAASHDPNAIVGVLQFYPYHIDALMQLAEVHSIRGGELERAGDMYERALYAMERSFHSDFRPWSADGQPPNGMHCRLPYEAPSNRPMFQALFRYASLLGRRGVHRTAVEVLRLLLQLEPRHDPAAALLCFDYHCLRSAQPDRLLLAFISRFSHRQTLLLPSYSYSAALALRLRGGDGGDDSTTDVGQLQRLIEVAEPGGLSAAQLGVRALVLYPTLLPPLLAKLGANSEPGAVAALTHAFFDSAASTDRPYSSLLARLVEVYVERSVSMTACKRLFSLGCAPHTDGAVIQAALHKQHASWLVSQAGRVTAALDAASSAERAALEGAAHAVRLRALVGDHVPASWSSVLLQDFSDDVMALPPDEMVGGAAQQDGGALGGAGDQNQPFHIDRQMHPLLAFFATMLPSSGGAPMGAPVG